MFKAVFPKQLRVKDTSDNWASEHSKSTMKGHNNQTTRINKKNTVLRTIWLFLHLL